MMTMLSFPLSAVATHLRSSLTQVQLMELHWSEKPNEHNYVSDSKEYLTLDQNLIPTTFPLSSNQEDKFH